MSVYELAINLRGWFPSIAWAIDGDKVIGRFGMHSLEMSRTATGWKCARVDGLVDPHYAVDPYAAAHSAIRALRDYLAWCAGRLDGDL